MSLKVIQNGTIRKLGCGLLFAFHSNYGSIVNQFRDKTIHAGGVENLDFFHTLLHSTSPPRGPRRNIAIPFGTEKLEWWGYPMVKNSEDMYNRLNRILAC